MLEVIDAKYIADYKIWVKFNNGLSGQVDLENDLWGPVFEPLKDKSFFSSVKVSKIFGTLSWDNDADIAPEYLLNKLKQD